MIVIKPTQGSSGTYYDFTVVKNDTGHFIATPKINGTPYTMQEGDTIDFKISKTALGEAILTIVADANRQIVLTAEDSAKLEVGDYYCDITLNYASGNKDTFIKIPADGSRATSNFHVTYGV